jgi:hypothetical protein
MKKTIALAVFVTAALMACGSKNKNKTATPSNTGGTSGGSGMTGGQGYGGAGYGGTAPAPMGGTGY